MHLPPGMRPVISGFGRPEKFRENGRKQRPRRKHGKSDGSGTATAKQNIFVLQPTTT